MIEVNIIGTVKPGATQEDLVELMRWCVGKPIVACKAKHEKVLGVVTSMEYTGGYLEGKAVFTDREECKKLKEGQTLRVRSCYEQ